VAYPCLEIKDNPLDIYKYTVKGNLVAVVSNGTAVLGLGNIGASASKPVMEGKALLFKVFAGIDCFDLEVDETDPKKFVEIVKSLQATFGGVNLEDIKAPECFEIEEKLKEACNIPVMHDDQHGTAIISAAALINALEIQGKKAEDIKMVVNGAGAAAVACTNLYISLGVKKEHIVMCDSKGVIRADSDRLTEVKRKFATTRDLHTLAEALVDADLFLGLSVRNILTADMIRTMAPRPIVFALANPDPEIDYESAIGSRPDIIFATGRSDYPNQINNVLGFPYIFRGALDTYASAITEEMKLAAARALARIAKEPVPDEVKKLFPDEHLSFSREYILPKAFDPRLLTEVSAAVAEAAEKSGVARRPIADMAVYRKALEDYRRSNAEIISSITSRYFEIVDL
jgi:malate dehydrogenase (oxaloacetate-decarboxylating)(NADP+)